MTRKLTAAITGVGGYVPPDKLTNADLEKMVETNDEWIRTRTGISERRILKGEGKASSDLGAPAVLELCHKRGIDPKEIDCLIQTYRYPQLYFCFCHCFEICGPWSSRLFGYFLPLNCCCDARRHFVDHYGYCFVRCHGYYHDLIFLWT